MARRRDPKTLSLLEWQPTTPVDRFEPTDVRAATLAAQISKAVGKPVGAWPELWLSWARAAGLA